MKIFIAGCGRSGTTLIRDLMNCFQETYVLVDGPYGESPFSRFADISRAETHLVIKRTGQCWRTLSSLPDKMGLIYCVRHPFDVLTSTHPLTQHTRKFHITPERWSSEYRALRDLRMIQPDRQIFILRYEDLVHTPDSIQAKIAAHFGLTPNHRFTENGTGIHIVKDSIEKWKRNADLYAYLQTIPQRFRPLMYGFCEEFEYLLPADYATGTALTGLENEKHPYLALLHISNPNDLEVLHGKPFFWMGGGLTTFDVKSSFTGSIQVSFKAIAGPSHPEAAKRHLRITAGNFNKLITIQPGSVRLEVPVQAGENEITFDVIEKPTRAILPNGDTRPLILGVLNLKMERR
jgi:hypothetical protein